MSVSYKVENVSISAARDRAMFNTFAGNYSYVVKDIGNELAVGSTANSFVVTLGTGEAVICGGSMTSDANSDVITLGENESGYIVIEVDLSQSGTNICRFAAVPQIVQQNINDGSEYVYDLPLYQYTTSSEGVQNMIDIREIKESVIKDLENDLSELDSKAVKSVNNITPNSIGNVDLNMKFYSAPSQLGLTNGSATLTQIWNAMPLNSVFMSQAEYIASSDRPNGSIYYEIHILKSNNSRGAVFAYAKGSDNDDYRMYLNSNNVPGGNWIPLGNIMYKVFTEVTKLGLTSGSATVQGVLNALSQNQVFIGGGNQFATSELPNSYIYGTMLIAKTYYNRPIIEYFYRGGNANGDSDYRMFATDGATVTGTWETELTNANGYSSTFNSYTKVTSNANFNNFTTPGNYVVATNAIAATISNFPLSSIIARAGVLTVRQLIANSGSLEQEFVDYAYGSVFRRVYASGSWTSWIPLAEDDQNYRKITDIKTINLTSSSAVANGATATCTASVPTSNSTYSTIYYIVQSCSYGFAISQVSQSGNTLSCTAQNASGATHTLTVRVTCLFVSQG